MSQKINPCPHCGTRHIIVIVKNKKTAWPECWKCGYKSKDKYEEYLKITYTMVYEESPQKLLEFAADLWNEIIDMENMEKEEAKAKEMNKIQKSEEDEEDFFMHVPIEDLIEE